ncbi:hypothetical protein BH23THE1_BH23THE1_20880 [soil metagenome]
MNNSKLGVLLFLFAASLSFSLGQNNNNISAVTIGESNLNSLSVLPPVGEPVPIPNNPFSAAEGAPEIVLKYNNSIYQGELRSAIFASGDVNDNMPSFEDEASSITAIIPEQIINMTQNEQIQLLINENPQPELQPNSLSSTLYHMNGNVSKVLSLKEEAKRDTFIVDEDKGEYLLLTVATWLPNPDNYLTTSGYVTYVFRVNVL